MANLLNCNILFTNGSDVFIYDFASNTATNVSGSILNLNTSLPYIGITHNIETIFLADSSTNTYLEFSINNQNSFSAEYIRTLYPNSHVDNWYAVPVKNPNLVLRGPTTAKAPNLLISISGNSVIEWFFSSKSLQETFTDGRTIVPTYSNVKFNVSNGNGIKDISFSRRENKFICTYGNEVKVYDYESGTLLSTASSPTITNIVGYFSNNFIPYVVTQNGQIYEVNFNLNTFTLIKTIPSFGGNIVSISQTKECVTVNNTSNTVTNNVIGSPLPPIAPQAVDRFITVNNYTPVNPAKSDFNLGGTKLMDPNFSLLGNGTFTLLTTDSVWKNKKVGSSYQSPLLRSLVWRDIITAPNATEYDGWAGYSVVINVPTTKTYYIGCGGGVRLWAKINGETLFETNNYYLPGVTTDIISEEYVTYWHVYPVTLSAGTNVVELMAYTQRYVVSSPYPYFGFEIYDNTYSQLVNATTTTDLNIIFTTTNKVGSYFDVAYSSTKNSLLHGYICDEGYVYNSTLNACVKYESNVDPVYIQTEVYGLEVDKCLHTLFVTGVGVPGSGYLPQFFIHRYDTNGRVESNRFIRELQFRTHDDIAHTEEKFWLSSLNFLFEYKIYHLKPFFAAHSRTIKMPSPYLLGKGLSSISGNTLIGNVGGYIVEIDVNGNTPIITNKFVTTPTISTNQLRDITYTPNGKIICTFDDELIQYDYSTGNVEYTKSLANYWSSTPLCALPVPQGVVHEYNGLNLVNECGFFYVMGDITGNTFGRILNMGNFTNGLSKITECNCIVEKTNIVLQSETVPSVSPPSYLLAVEPTTFNSENNILDTIVYGDPYVIAGGSFIITSYLSTPGLWKNVSGNEGPLKRTIVWTTNQTLPNWGPTQKWIGFNECINIPTEKTYYIGMGGDDAAALLINGELILKFNGDPTPGISGAGNSIANNYRRWHIFPIKLKAGTNTFEFLGTNRLGIAGFGFELYDNTLAQLTSATNISQLNIIFSTANKRNTNFNVVRNGFFNYNGYNNQYVNSVYGYDYLGKYCPEGYYYESCSDSCVKYQENSNCIARTTQEVNCDLIVIGSEGIIASYNYPTNNGAYLNPSIAGLPGIVPDDVAHTETKLWLTNGNTILECIINSFSPFSATYNRTLTYPGAVILDGLAAIDDNTLITSIAGDIIELNISGTIPIGTTKFSTPPGTSLTDIVFISQDKIICTFFDRIIQYNYTTGAIESVITPTATSNLQSVFTYNNNFYVIDFGGNIYLIDPSLSTLSYTQNIGGNILGASQLSDCLCIPSSTKIVITGDTAIAPRVATQSVKPISYDTNFTANGALLYNPGYNYDGTGNVVATLTQNNLWKNNTGTNGPIDRSIVWTIDQTPYPYSTPWDPTLLWLGFSETISSPTTKTYYIGMAGNDFVALRVNGVTVLNLGYNKNALNSGLGWYNWRIYPVTLSAGENIVEFLGCNLTKDSGFGFEVYDNTASEIISANNIGDLNIIFTTANKQGNYSFPGLEYFDVVYNAIELIYDQSYEVGEPNSFLGYRCIDSGFVYDSSDNTCKSFIASATTGCTALENVFIPPGISINPCDVLYTDGGIIYHYDYVSNVTTDISTYISGYILPDSVLEIAHTTSKIWVSTGFEIYEYDIISLSPFSGAYNRTIITPPTSIGLGPGLTYLSGNTLIGSSGADIVEIDVTNLTAIINTVFTLPTNKKITALIYSDSELTCTHFDTILINNTVTQHNYPSGTINFDYTLPPTVTYPSGLFTNNNLLYVADVGGEVYEINTSNAFTATFTKNMGYFVAGMSQISGCTTFSFTSSTVSTYPPPCIFSALTVTGCTDLIIIDITTTNIECLIPFGTLTVTITGGCAPYTYSLLDQSLAPVPGQIIISSANTVTFTGLSQGTYFVSVIDCSNPLPIVSTETGVINSDITLFTNVFQLNSQQVCVTITGGTPPYNVVLNGTLVSWDSNNQTNCYDIPCEDGNVYYEITDSCQAQYSSVTISYNEEFILGNDELEVIYHLDGDPRIDGTNLYNGILTSDDIIYGINSVPRANWQGPGFFNPLRPAIFSCDTSGNYSVIKRYDCSSFGYTIPANSCESAPPQFLFELNSNEIYGTAFAGGANNQGGIFKSDRAGNITFIKSFSGNTDEGSSITELIPGTNGGLYATLWEGGQYRSNSGNTAYGGTILSCNTQGQQTVVLHSFDGIPNDGYRPGSLYYSENVILEYNNKIYGTTGGGGLYGANPPFILGNVGTIFSIDTNGQNYSTIHNFGQGLDGFGQSTTWLSIINGKLFGTLADSFKNYSSSLGLPGDGLIFSCDTSGSNYEIIRYFRDSNISQTPLTPLLANNGKLYGIVWDKQSGGAAPSGAIFKYDLSNRSYSAIHAFSRYVDGYNPRIVGQASDNYVYGISAGGGLNGAPGWGGTVWRFCPTGVVCTKKNSITENILISSGNCCSAVTTTELISQEVTVITSTTLSALTIITSGACLNGIDIIFSIDYTGSMGGPINTIKSNIASIANTVASLSNNNYRFGLVLFDEGSATSSSIAQYLTTSIYTNLPASQKYVLSSNSSTQGPSNIYITALEVMSLNNLASFLNKLNVLSTTTFPLGDGLYSPEPSDVSLELISPPPSQIAGSGAVSNFAGIFRPNVGKFVITVTDAVSSNFDDDFTYSAAEINFANTIANKFNTAGIKHILWRSTRECPLGSPPSTCLTDPILTLTRNNNGFYVSGFTTSSVNRINQILSATCTSAITYTSASITFSAITGYSTTTTFSSVTNTTIVGDCCKITGTTQFSCLTPSLILVDYLDPTCINDGYITVQVTGGTPNYSITATNVTTNQQFVQNNITNIVTFSNLLAGTYNITAVDANGLFTNILNITLVNSFQIGIIQTIQTDTGTTYCFIVQGSNANTVQVTVDNNLFFTANTGVLTCFDIPIEDCGTLHTIEVVEIIDYEEGALLVANDGIGCDPASQIVKTGTTINGRPSYSFIQNGDASLIYWDTTIIPNRWVLKNTTTNTICATLAGTTNPLLQNYPIGNTTNWQFISPTPIGCSCFRGVADFQTGYIIYPGCSDQETFFVPCPDLTLNVISFINPGCNCDGIITLEATGGTTPYTYTLTDNISFTATNNTGIFTNLCEGTYYPSVYDGSLTALTATVTPVTLVNTFDVSTQVTNIVTSSNTTTFCITVSGGSGSYTIQIGIPPFASYYPAIPGTYCYDLFAGQCYDIFVYDTTFVDCNYSANTCMPTQLFGCVSNSSTNTSCGSNNGTISVEVSGGSPSYLYTLYNNGNVVTTYTTNSLTHTFSGITGGTYSVTIQDDTGTIVTCFNGTISEEQFFADIYTQSTCEPIGQYCVIVSGGTLPYTLFDGTNTIVLTGEGLYCYSALCGTYNINIQDSSTCQANEVINILCGIEVTGSTTLNSCGVVGSGSVTIYSIIGGTPPFQYSFDNGVNYYTIPLLGPYTFSSEIFGPLFPGDYPFIVKDASGCTATTQVSVVENPVVNVSATTTPESCDYNGSGTILINVVGGSSPYQYSIDGGVTYSGTNYFTGLTVGTYNISVLDSNNCEGTTTVVIDPPITLSASSTPENCDYSSGGTITLSNILGGTPPYEYSLNGGTFTNNSYFTGLTSGQYTITIKDISGCTATTTFDVNPPILISATTTPENCYLSSGGTITAIASEGTPPYQYAINYGSFSSTNYFTGLTIGDYTISAIDISGCSATTIVSISASTPLTLDASVVNESCFGGGSGSIFLVVGNGVPPYQYSLTGGLTYSNNPFFADLYVGTYEAVVLDSLGCSASTIVVVSAATPVVVSATSFSGFSCSGLTPTTLTMSANGGSPTYTYLWQPVNVTSQSITVNNYLSSAGTYTFTAITYDRFGCSGSTTITFTLSPAQIPTLTIYSAGTLYCDGSQFVTLSASVNTYYSQISWSNGQTNVSAISATTPGDYYYVIQNSGCTYTSDTVTVDYPVSIPPEIIGSTVLCPCSATTLTLINNGEVYTNVQWNTLETGDTITVSSCTEGSYDYYVTALDIYGCSVTSNTATVTYVALDVNLFILDATCCDCGDGYAEVQILSGFGPFTFDWIGTDSTTNVAQNLLPGSYTVNITDSTGCFASYTFDISCQDIAVCLYVPLTDASGEIILNPDGTVSFYNPDDTATGRVLRTTSNVPEECCIQTSVDGSPLQFCNGQCYWNTSGCTEDLPDKIIFGIDQNNGITLPNNTTTGVTQSQECQTQVSFDYLFNFDCQSLLQCIQENYSGSVLTFLSGLSASATIEVLQSGTTSTYVTEQVVPIWNFNFYDQPTGVYFNGSGCTTLDQLIYNELGSNCSALTENTFAVIWRTASFKLYDSLAGKTIKLGLLLDGFNCDYNILLDNIKIEQVCIISSDQILSDSDCPGFDLVKVVDNKKSWVYNESLYDRDWFHLKYRDTSYDDYHERLDINTKEVDLELDPARAIEYDMYCYAQSEPCFTAQDNCNFPELLIPARRFCFPSTSPHKLQYQTLPLIPGQSYTIAFSVQAIGFGGPATLLVGVSNALNGVEVPLVDNIVVSANGVTDFTITVTLPTTFSGYTYLYFRSADWIDPAGNRRFCLLGSPNLSVKQLCDPSILSIDDFIGINSATTFNEFIELIENQLIDVKDRQSLSEYATLQYMYERYLGCGNNCATQSNQYDYTTLNTFSNLIGGYWNNLIEQFVPATTIWKGGTRSYRNGIFHQPKYEYRNFQIGYCEECQPSPSVSGYCYVTISDKTLQLTPIGFSALSTTIANKLNDVTLKSLFLDSPAGCVYQNSRDCCVTLDCFVSGTVIFNFKEGANKYSATTTFSSIAAPPSSTTYLNMFYDGLTNLGYNNSTPYNNFEWSTQDLQNCGLPINIATTLLLTYSCLTSTTVVTTATTGDITYQLRFNNFISSDNMTPSGRFVISGGTIIYGVVTDLSSTFDGYIYKYNISNSSFNVVKTFNFSVDQIGNPASGLILAPDGYLYGTTLKNNLSGSLNYGALYRINPVTNAYQTLKKFTIADGGKCWMGQELVYDGLNNRLYIPLVDGSNCSIYTWNLSTQTGNIFYNFGIPVGNIFLTLDSGSNKLYCATTDGGTSSRGSIFSLNISGALTPTTLHSFNPSNPLPNNVINPSGALVKDTSIPNVFYGLTNNSSSAGYMSIYRFDTSTNSCNVIYSFVPPHTALQGLNPQGDLVYQNNYLYGICVTNGPTNYGTLFRYNITTDVFGTIHLFGTQPNDALYSIRSYSNLQYNPTDNFFYGISPLDGGTTLPRNNGQIYRFNFTGGTATATTNVTGVALYTCEYIGIQAGTPPITWEKELTTISGTTFSISGDSCPRYCPPNVEVIVEDYTNTTDPCKEIELIERCETIFATHIDDDIWFEGTVTVEIVEPTYVGDPDIGPIVTG